MTRTTALTPEQFQELKAVLLAYEPEPLQDIEPEALQDLDLDPAVDFYAPAPTPRKAPAPACTATPAPAPTAPVPMSGTTKISIKIPRGTLAATRAHAAALGIPYQRLINRTLAAAARGWGSPIAAV